MEYPISLKSINTGRSSLEDWLKKNYPDFKNYLDKTFRNCDYRCKLYMFYNDIKSIPLCTCGKPVKFHGYRYGFAQWCGPICAQKNDIVRGKCKKTIIEKYGEESLMGGKIFQKKSKETKLLKYNNPYFNNPDKMKDTCFKKYGKNNPQQVEEIRKKTMETCFKKYGVNTFLISEGFDKHSVLKRNNPYFVDFVNGKYIWACSNPDCTKCEEKIFELDYFTYYQRLNKYHIEPCPKCLPLGETVLNNKNTNIEKFIREILDEYKIEYQTNIRPFDNKKELDIYIPDRKLAIECNGCYWHKFPEKSKNYHYDKFKMCLDNNVQLLTIWEDQIYNKPKIIKGIILSKLGIFEKRIFARKCDIKIIDNKTSKQFLTENHLQGSVNGSVNIGLYYCGELISIMTFGKGRKCLNSKNEWELYRFCNKLGIQVIGGASKLFRHFLKTYKPDEIISFSSNDISVGDLYRKLNFIYCSNSISYWYIKNKQRFHRFKFRKSELIKQGFDSLKTEEQIMDERGFLRIYDSGQSKWIFKPTVK